MAYGREGAAERWRLCALQDEVTEEVATPEALQFVAELQQIFGDRVHALQRHRTQRRQARERGEPLGLLAETREVRDSAWQVAPVPHSLRLRQVELTAPPRPKMIAHAMTSGADVYMADFEDALSPTWVNLMGGQLALREAIAVHADLGHWQKRSSSEGRQAPILMVRPRGWHLLEKHFEVGGRSTSAALFDAGLFLFHNTAALLRGGARPLLYLPKLEHFLEARLWREIIEYSERRLAIPTGTVRVSVLIETLPAALQMDEILFELKHHVTALNCGRWDYWFSFLKCHAEQTEVVLPDRDQLHMDQETTKAYADLLISTCHRRGALAIGGMAAQIPNRRDPSAHIAAISAVALDKRREAQQGFDGTWVAHPGLVRTARDAFRWQEAQGTPHAHAGEQRPEELARRLLRIPGGTVSEQGVRENVRIALQYFDSWFRGEGCVPLYGRMEDAATAEICRTHLWHLQNRSATLLGGVRVTPKYIADVIEQEWHHLRGQAQYEGEDSVFFGYAKETLQSLVLADRCEEFFTFKAYERL